MWATWLRDLLNGSCVNEGWLRVNFKLPKDKADFSNWIIKHSIAMRQEILQDFKKGIRIINDEYELKIEEPTGLVLAGRADIYYPEKRVIKDIKTGDFNSRDIFQIRVYQFLAKRIIGDANIAGELIYCKVEGKAVIERDVVTVSTLSDEPVWEEQIEYYLGIMAETEPPSPALCSNCEDYLTTLGEAA